MESDILEDMPPEVYYWDGTTSSTGLAFWNNIYQLQKTKPVIVFHTKKISAWYVTFSWRYYNNMPTSDFDTMDANVYSRVIGDKTYSSGFNNIPIDTFSLYFTISNDTVTAIRTNSYRSYIGYIDTAENYSQPYTPLYNGSPATKKYVDDAIGALTPAISAIEEVVG